MPKFSRKGAQDGLPPALDIVNVYPEQSFHVHGCPEIRLKCRGTVTSVVSPKDYVLVDTAGEIDAGYLHPDRWPYFLETVHSAHTGNEAVDAVVNSIELITDFLTFQLQHPVKIVNLNARSMKVAESGGHEVVLFSGTPYYRILKDAVVNFAEPAYVSFDLSPIQSSIPSEVQVALKWLSKSLAARSVIDKFAFCWIALEILAAKWKMTDGTAAKALLECPRCRKTIATCPNCGKTTETRPRLGRRIQRMGMDLGREEELMKRLWSTRQMFHGRLSLEDAAEFDELAKQTQQLKSLLVDAMKIRLGIPFSRQPMVPSSVPVTWSTMWLHGTNEEETNSWQPHTS